MWRPGNPCPPRCGDLARTAFLSGAAPLPETVLRLVEMLRRRVPAAPAARPTRPFLLPATARPLLELIPRHGPWPEFLDPAVSDLDEALDLVKATPARVLREQRAMPSPGRPSSWRRALADGDAEALETVRRSLRDLRAVLVAPSWPQIVRAFRDTVREQAAVLAAAGLAALFDTLHPDLSWQDGVLERVGRSGEYWLDGTGLRLVPRAATLRSLRDPCGTGELAARLAISASSASEHTAALRAARLVQTVRRGQSVQHSLTARGRDFLGED